MAHVINKYCPYCKKVYYHTNGNCNFCSGLKAMDQKIKDQLIWESKTLEEKVEDLHQRLLKNGC